MRPSLPSARRGFGEGRGGAYASALLGVGIVVGAGCGTSQPPLLTEIGGGSADGGQGSGSGGGSSSGSLLAEAGPPPSCDAGFQGGVCGCLDLTLLTDPPNLYFVLDRSGSMTVNNKWVTIRQVIADVMHRIGPRARFGAAVFPSPNASKDECAAGTQVMAMMTGDAPAGTYGPATGAFTEATNYPAGGGTPTAATFTALTPTLTALPGKTFVILATDGGPNCDPNVICDSSACIPNIESDQSCTPTGPDCCTTDRRNCLDSTAAVNAVTALAAAGIPTYVVGVPGSGPYAAVLDQMALGGGTARATTPYYFPIDTASEADFTATLSTVAAQITATCVLSLSAAPPDPNQVNVYLDGAVVPSDPTNGWTLSGATVTLQGTTCASVLSGAALDLRIVAGCPTVLK